MRKRSLFPFLAIGMAVNGAVVAAEEAEPVARGAAGLVALPFVARNGAPDPIVCSAALAHWYSIDFGKAERGESVQATSLV